MAPMANLSAKVHGRVQGVFFRYFVYDRARELGLKGYVSNLPSGDTVDVEAEGDKTQLDKLLDELKLGPPGSRVRRVETKWSGYSGKFKDFRIRY
jgi:acylphosphatase